MKINNLIANIDKEIQSFDGAIKSLQDRKEKFEKVLQKFPEAEYERNSIYIENIWSQVSRLQFAYASSYRTSEIKIKCMLPEKNKIEHMNICAKIVCPTIATIQYNFQHNATATNQPRIHTIIINDFRSIIPMECPKRKSFIFRMRQHILDRLTWQKLQIDPASYNKEEFETYLMIK